MLLYHLCHLIRRKIGIVYLNIAFKGQLFSVIGIKAVLGGGLAHFPLAPFKIALGFLVGKSVFRFIAFKAHVKVGAKLNHVTLRAILLEKTYHGVNIVKLALHIKIAHIGKHESSEITLCKKLKHLSSYGVVKLAPFGLGVCKKLSCKLYGHVVMEKAQVGDFAKLLTDRHFPYRVWAYYNNKVFHSLFLSENVKYVIGCANHVGTLAYVEMIFHIHLKDLVAHPVNAFAHHIGQHIGAYVVKSFDVEI